jgi:hypothetical protein
MNLRNRWLWLGVLVLIAIVLLSLLAAPRSSTQGSTYSRAPSGYGAWYAYMEQQNLPIQRWQRPFNDLLNTLELVPPIEQISTRKENRSQDKSLSLAQANSITPITFVQINGRNSSFDEEWVKQGNVLVLVGVRTRVSKAPFRSTIASPVGAVKVETTRRFNQADLRETSAVEARLSDAYGAVVWERQLGEGQIIYSSTPYLAANAYQDEPGNFKFLAQLVSESGYPIYVDEYLHGYKDKDLITAEGAESLTSYLAKTPLSLLALQAVILLLALIWGQRRLGPPKRLLDNRVDNSEAYVQALAGVLQKANCSNFVVETIGKAEQLKAQRALGLGTTLADPETLIQAWVQQTGRPATELEDFLTPLIESRRLSDRELLLWLEKLQTVHRQLE